MTSQLRLIPSQGFVYASGDQTELVPARTAPAIHYVHGWNLSMSAGSATAMLFEYGTGSNALDVVQNRLGGAAVQSNQDLKHPYEIGAGSSVYVTVDGTAETSATVFYSIRD